MDVCLRRFGLARSTCSSCSCADVITSLNNVDVQHPAAMFAVGDAIHEKHMLHLHCYILAPTTHSNTEHEPWNSDVTFFMLLRSRVGMYCTTATMSTVSGKRCCSACRLPITLPILHCRAQHAKSNCHCHSSPPSLQAGMVACTRIWGFLPFLGPAPLFPETLGSQVEMLPMPFTQVVLRAASTTASLGVLLSKQMQHITALLG